MRLIGSSVQRSSINRRKGQKFGWYPNTAGGGASGGGSSGVPAAVESALQNYLMGDYKLGSNPDNADGRAELVALDYAAATTLR